jgi:hypothetical protein
MQHTSYVNGAGLVCDQRTSKFFVPCGGIHGRTHGCKGSFFKSQGRETQEGAWWVLMETEGRQHALLSQVLLKLMIIYGKEEQGGYHSIINERGGDGWFLAR